MKRTAFRLLALLLVCSGIGFAQQPVNEAQIAGTPTATGNGLTGAGSQRVTIASDNTAFSVNATLSAETTKVIGTVRMVGNVGAVVDFAGQNAAAPANALLTGGTFFTVPTTLTNGDASPLQLDNSGKLLVNCTGCSAGSTVSLIPATSGGLTTKHFVTAASDNAQVVKGSAGQLYTIDAYNNGTYPQFVKFYNASASPTGCGATNLFKVVGVQAGTKAVLHTEQGWAMGTGIGVCVTKGIADADDTAVLLGDMDVDLGYK